MVCQTAAGGHFNNNGEAAVRRAEAFSTAVASEKLLAVYATLVRAKGLR